MAYIEQNLIVGENVIYRAKLHWIIFQWTIIWFAISMICFSGNVNSAGIIFLALAIVLGIFRILDYTTSEFGVTNKRVLIKVGWAQRRSLELLLTKIESIAVVQDLQGKMLGYGTIIITGTGGSKEVFPSITNPFEFRMKLQEQISNVQESK
ncbi:MAG: PH domain-containing protein [Bacteroidota bacterium]|jgi:uncharacterized membrane protein YdbT with pleckstrin-like domain